MKKSAAYVCFFISALYIVTLIDNIFNNHSLSIPLQNKTGHQSIIQQLHNNKQIEQKHLMLTIENPSIAEKIFLAQHGEADFLLQLTVAMVIAFLGFFVLVLAKEKQFICAAAVKYLNTCCAILSVYFLLFIIRRHVMDFYIHQYTTNYNFDKYGLGNTHILVWVLLVMGYATRIYKKAVVAKQENDLTI